MHPDANYFVSSIPLLIQFDREVASLCCVSVVCHSKARGISELDGIVPLWASHRSYQPLGHRDR
jgi:hypothetical protein